MSLGSRRACAKNREEHRDRATAECANRKSVEESEHRRKSVTDESGLSKRASLAGARETRFQNCFRMRLLDVVTWDDMKIRRGMWQVRLELVVGDDLADCRAAGGVDRGDTAFEPVGGGFDFAFVEEERAEIDCGLRVVWRDGQRFAEAPLGFLD